MGSNYLASAIDAQACYYEQVRKSLYSMMGDLFKAHPNLYKVMVEVDYIPHPPYSCTYVLRDVSVDMGCGWVVVESVHVPNSTHLSEDIGKVIHYLYTHSQAIVSVKGVGILEWSRSTYIVCDS